MLKLRYGYWFQPGFINASSWNYQIMTTTIYTYYHHSQNSWDAKLHVAHICTVYIRVRCTFVPSKPPGKTQQSSLWQGWSRWELSWLWNSFRWYDIHAKRSKNNCSYLTASWVQSIHSKSCNFTMMYCELFHLGTKQANLVRLTLVILWLLLLFS